MADKKHKHPLGPSNAQSKGQHQKPRGGFYTFLLLTGGLASTGLGAGVAFGSEYSWQLVKLGRIVHGAGVQNGTLMMGGLILFGIGLLSRKFSLNAGPQAAPPARKDRTLETLSETVQRDLLQLKSTLFQLSEELSGLTEAQEALVQAQADSMKANQGSSDHQEAMYRLAASLDQLGVKLDDKMQHLGQRVEERMEKVGSAVDSARASIVEELHETGFTPASAAGIHNRPSAPGHQPQQAYHQQQAQASATSAAYPSQPAHPQAPVYHQPAPAQQQPFGQTQHHEPAPGPSLNHEQELLEVVVDLEPDEEARAQAESEALLSTLDELDNIIGDARPARHPSGPVGHPSQPFDAPMPPLPETNQPPPRPMPPMPGGSSPNDLDALWPEGPNPAP